MDYFNYRDDTLYAEEVSLVEIARRYETPCYVYSRATIERHWHAFDGALPAAHPHLVCYAVKANANLAVLNILARLGSGFDIVSGGELERVLLVGGKPSKVVFSGVGKTVKEMQRALEVGIYCFNVESEAELHRLNYVAGQLGKRAPIALRVNPDVDAKTHPYISTGLKDNKFGIEIALAPRVYAEAAALPNLEIIGVACHIGSQLTELTPFIDAWQRLLALVDQLSQQGIKLRHLDIGGGLGVRYRDENPPHPFDYGQALMQIFGSQPYQILLEPGRAIVANAGILLTKVEYLKHSATKNFAIVDAAMNDLIRPSLYGAWQAILPVRPRQDVPVYHYDIVGPICETGDFLGKSRPLALREGDLLAVRTSGAYGFTMSSNYNSRPRAAELMVDGTRLEVVRRRESIEDLWQLEKTL